MTIKQEARDRIESAPEIEIYFMVDECGDFIWRMNHSMANGRIPTSAHAEVSHDVANTREVQSLCVEQLPRFGINDALDGVQPTAVYWEWYRRWNHWHKNVLTDEQWGEILAAMREGEDLQRFYPESFGDK